MEWKKKKSERVNAEMKVFDYMMHETHNKDHSEVLLSENLKS